MGVNGIYGLSGSGLDIESMVKVGMMSKQNEYDKMAQKYTKNEWTKNALIEINNQITTFNMSSLTDYKLSSKMNAKTATSSNEATVKATANATAGNMAHKVSVTNLSTNAYLLGTKSFTRYDLNTTNGTGTVNSDSTSIQIKDVLFSSLKVNNGTVSGYIAKAEKSASWLADKNLKFGYDSNGSSPNNQLKLSDVAISFTINDGVTKNDAGTALKEIEVSYTYAQLLGTEEGTSPVTFNDLVSKINNGGLNVKASYDSINDKFSFYNSKGGEKNGINISIGGTTGWTGSRASLAAENFLNNMGLYQSKDGVLYNGDKRAEKNSNGNYENYILFNHASSNVDNPSTGENKFAGEYGKISIDGAEYKTEDNKITVGGVTYNFLNTTAANEAVTVTVGQDTDAIVDKVKSFVESYNKILSGLYEKYDEKKESGYNPLTQTQKDQMKDEQIEKWEEKAKKGLLYHDQTLSKIIGQMREAVSGTIEGVDSKYNSIYSLGISTVGIKGQLTLDETKLRNALAEDSESVYNVFAKLTTEDANGVKLSDSESYSKSGIAQRLGDIFTNATKLIRDRAGSSTDITEDSDLNNLLRELQTKMSNFKKLMTAFEDRLYKKYDAMEVTLSKLGSQLNFITGGQ